MSSFAIQNVSKAVESVLLNEGSGHDWLHIVRVMETAIKLAKEENADVTVVTLSALLHDVDDRKVTGDRETETTLPNAKRIMKQSGIDEITLKRVVETIQMTGFSKSLGKTIERSLEANILSDADQLDAIGAIGIARAFVYGASKQRPMFLPDETLIQDLNTESYIKSEGSTIAHFFDKLLKLRRMMMTPSGQKEAERRHQLMLSFLEAFFDEVSAPPDWHKRLNAYRD